VKTKTGWEIMRRSVMALFLRELKTRFGKYQLGYAWALLEPLATITILIIVFSALGAHSYPGISFPVFLATGVIINSLFVEISNRSIKAMEANSALFNYRPIRPIDTVISRSLLELVLHVAIYAGLALLYVGFGGEFGIRNMPLLLMVFLLMAIFSCGIGVLFMLVTDAYSDADRVLPMLTRPLFFISGVFFSIQVVPREYWPLLLWNPIFHGIELARSAVSTTYSADQVSLGYLALSAMAVFAFSLMLYRRREHGMRLR